MSAWANGLSIYIVSWVGFVATAEICAAITRLLLGPGSLKPDWIIQCSAADSSVAYPNRNGLLLHSGISVHLKW